MKKVGLIAAIAAIICGIAVYLYFGSIEQRINNEVEKQKVVTTRVVVAAQLIPPYTEITEEMLRYEEFPADYANKKAAKEFDEVVGLKADGTIVEGELILTSMLGTSEDVGASLSYDIPDGMRAMTVEVGINSGVGGYITKGDLIDLMLYLPVEAEEKDKNKEDNSETEKKTEEKGNKIVTTQGETYQTNRAVTTVILEAAMVLELGDVTFDSSAGGTYGCLTLALTPDDCLKLYAAMKQADSSNGQIYTILRQRGDVSETDTGFYSFAGVLEKGEE